MTKEQHQQLTKSRTLTHHIKKEYNHSNIVYISSSNQIVIFKVEYPDDHIQGSPC